MTLDSYTNLIKYLPYLDQAFETKKDVWLPHKIVNLSFANFHDKKFINNKLKISRRDLFLASKQNFYEAIFLTILWGYPRNMRGNNFNTILHSLNIIESTLLGDKVLSENDFKRICKNLKTTGIGLSTLSKLLYFFEYRIEGHQCLILDRRIIEILNDKDGFIELKKLTKNRKITEFNKAKIYIEYLDVMEDISIKNDYKPDQLELFLFSMGRNLKQG